MKKSILLVYIVLHLIKGYSQQVPTNTLFEWNRIDFNPAFSGTSSTTNITIQSRQQWVGFADAPKSQYVSSNAYLPGGIGVGGVLFNTVAGPTRQTGIKGAFAKQLKINRDLKLSLSLSIGVYQNAYDKEKLYTGIPGDPAIENGSTEQKLAPDASFGAVMYSNEYFVGFSITNLTESKYDFFSTEDDFANPIKRTYYLTGGYTFMFNKELRYSPSVLIKKTIGLPLQIDVSNRIFYKPLIAGISYRSSNELSFILGIRFGQLYEFAYSYDYSLNKLGDYSKGSHEFVLCFKLANQNISTGYKKESVLWE